MPDDIVYVLPPSASIYVNCVAALNGLPIGTRSELVDTFTSAGCVDVGSVNVTGLSGFPSRPTPPLLVYTFTIISLFHNP